MHSRYVMLHLPTEKFSSTKKPPFTNNTTLNPLWELQKGILPRILCDAKCSTCIKLMLHDYAMVLPDVQQNLVQTIHDISAMSSSSFEGSACFNKFVMRVYFWEVPVQCNSLSESFAFQ